MSRTPSFDALFGESCVGTPLYLELLNFTDEAAVEQAVQKIREGIAVSSDPASELARLLNDRNWRPHLVAAVGALVGCRDKRVVDALWQAFDCVSWVTPQLACALYLVDAEFEAQARRRIDLVRGGGNPPRPNTPDLQSWPSLRESPKSLNALIYLCARVPRCDEWLPACLDDSALQDLIDDNWDDGSGIAENWLDAAQIYTDAIDPYMPVIEGAIEVIAAPDTPSLVAEIEREIEQIERELQDDPPLNLPAPTGYPEFAQLFELGSSGLVRAGELLHMRRADGVADALTWIRAGLQTSSDPEAEVCAMLTASDWRPKLVAGIAILLGIRSTRVLDLLWSAISTERFVSPQLSAVASQVDESFRDRVREWVADSDLARELTPDGEACLTRESGNRRLYPKALHAMIELVRPGGDCPWLDDAVTGGRLSELIGDDVDRGGHYARQWSDRLKAVLQ